MNETDPHMDASRQSLPYYLAEEFAMHTNRPLFITGKAGTGKTTFLRKLREQTPNHPCLLLRAESADPHRRIQRCIGVNEQI